MSVDSASDPVLTTVGSGAVMYRDSGTLRVSGIHHLANKHWQPGTNNGYMPSISVCALKRIYIKTNTKIEEQNIKSSFVLNVMSVMLEFSRKPKV